MESEIGLKLLIGLKALLELKVVELKALLELKVLVVCEEVSQDHLCVSE